MPGSVVMFVLNPVTRDRRVLKEAGTLAAEGYEVTVIGINLAKDRRPAREVLADGVTILRVPLSMSPEWWRPSPRYFVRLRDLARRRRMLVRHRVKRTRGAARLAYQRRRHRASRWASSTWRRRRSRARLFAIRRRQAIARWFEAWRADPRTQSGRAVAGTRRRWAGRRKRARAGVARRNRLTRAFVRRQTDRIARFTTQRSARRWAVHRAGQRLRRGQGAVGGALRPFLRGLREGLLAIPHMVVQSLFTAWAAIYLFVNRLTGGELDWALNTRYRWTSYARTAARLAPPASVYHGHDFSAIAAAVAAARRHGGRVVYDSHELYVESGSIGGRSRLLKWALRRIERAQYSRSDHLVCVNQLVAQELHERYGRKPTTVVHNCPPRWHPPRERRDPIRTATGIPQDALIALYQGGFAEVRGLRQMAEAVLAPGLGSVHLVYLGFGPMEAELREMAQDARYGGRLWVLSAVEPDELDEWVASADVCLMPNQPTTLNEIVSTPNKLFESIAAGVPVVTSDFPERRRIILDDPLGPLGAVCDPTDPASIADAMRGLLGRSPALRADLRRRCLEAAHERWNWETEAHRLVALYDSLVPAPGWSVRPVS